jgi:hypothetical protein
MSFYQKPINQYFRLVGSRRPLAFGLGFLFFAACSKAPEQPSIPDDKMARIMADLAIAEAATSGLTGYPKDSLMQTYLRQALDLHRVTRDSYEKNLRLYADDLPRMQQLTRQTEMLLGQEANPQEARGK